MIILFNVYVSMHACIYIYIYIIYICVCMYMCVYIYIYIYEFILYDTYSALIHKVGIKAL